MWTPLDPNRRCAKYTKNNHLLFDFFSYESTAQTSEKVNDSMAFLPIFEVLWAALWKLKCALKLCFWLLPVLIGRPYPHRSESIWGNLCTPVIFPNIYLWIQLNFPLIKRSAPDNNTDTFSHFSYLIILDEVFLGELSDGIGGITQTHHLSRKCFIRSKWLLFVWRGIVGIWSIRGKQNASKKGGHVPQPENGVRQWHKVWRGLPWKLEIKMPTDNLKPSFNNLCLKKESRNKT
jgi:hypothetical protein